MTTGVNSLAQATQLGFWDAENANIHRDAPKRVQETRIKYQDMRDHNAMAGIVGLASFALAGAVIGAASLVAPALFGPSVLLGCVIAGGAVTVVGGTALTVSNHMQAQPMRQWRQLKDRIGHELKEVRSDQKGPEAQLSPDQAAQISAKEKIVAFLEAQGI